MRCFSKGVSFLKMWKTSVQDTKGKEGWEDCSMGLNMFGIEQVCEHVWFLSGFSCSKHLLFTRFVDSKPKPPSPEQIHRPRHVYIPLSSSTAHNWCCEVRTWRNCDHSISRWSLKQTYRQRRHPVLPCWKGKEMKGGHGMKWEPENITAAGAAWCQQHYHQNQCLYDANPSPSQRCWWPWRS